MGCVITIMPYQALGRTCFDILNELFAIILEGMVVMCSSIDPQQIKVALLSGGSSGEREISLASGRGACSALREAGFTVDCLDPASKDDLKKLIEGSYDVAFLCLHGRKGEDGVVQGFLELIGLPYTGSGVLASALAMDKARAKACYLDSGIPTPRSITITSESELTPSEIIDELGSKCVVKAATEGSSLGVFIVEGEDELSQAMKDVFAYDSHAVIETYIKGIELTAAVLGNEDATPLPLIEIVPRNASYDFDSKYAPGGCEHICPARISEEMTARIQSYAVAAHKALGCRGVSRSDFILEEDGTFWMLETNTLPGMTSTSLLPDSAQVAGISFPELCTKLIEFALS